MAIFSMGWIVKCEVYKNPLNFATKMGVVVRMVYLIAEKGWLQGKVTLTPLLHADSTRLIYG